MLTISKKEGHLNVRWLLILYLPIIILTPFYTYYMAVSHGEEKKYPAATITSTACYYPQDIVFRYTMLIASSILALIFFLAFRWIEKTALRIKYPERISRWLFYTSEFSILLYCITIGTIDGKSTGPLHSPCAVGFFVILIIEIIQMTIFITKMRNWDVTAIGYWSLKAKQFLAFYVTAVWIRCLVGLALAGEEWEGKGDKFVVIVEWNTVFYCLMWVLSFAQEWINLNLVLRIKKNID